MEWLCKNIDRVFIIHGPGKFCPGCGKLLPKPVQDILSDLSEKANFTFQNDDWEDGFKDGYNNTSHLATSTSYIDGYENGKFTAKRDKNLGVYDGENK